MVWERTLVNKMGLDEPRSCEMVLKLCILVVSLSVQLLSNELLSFRLLL